MPPPKPRPTPPGKILSAHIKRIGLTQDELAAAIGVSRFTVNQVIRGKRALTTATALRLSRALNTTVEFWLNLQRDVDLYDALEELGPELGTIRRITK